jgi:hypothetical protein
MHAIGMEVESNQLELGIYFYPKKYVPKNPAVLKYFDAQVVGGRRTTSA